MSVTNYIVEVLTGDKIDAGMDARAFMTLHGENGTSTDKLTLFQIHKNNFQRGKKDKFWFGSKPFLGKIEHIEIWRADGLGASWFVDNVTVTCSKTGDTFVFPILRWIQSNRSHLIRCYDTSLPQSDPFKSARAKELEEKKKTYELYCPGPGLPAQCKTLPKDELFSFNFVFDIGKTIAAHKADSIWKLLLLKGGRFKSLDEFDFVYTTTFGEPAGRQRWQSDVFFGQQRLCGLNPSLISLCTEIPTKFGVTDQMMSPLIGGFTLQQAIDAKRLFIIDMEVLKDMPTQKDLIVPVPIALFFLNDDKELMPVAIQLFQQKAPDNPVFLPTDPIYTWILAKMWYNLAEANYHQPVSHLGFSHFMIESICVAANRNLSISHPLLKLLTPHFLYTIPVNTFGRPVLNVKGGIFDIIMSSGKDGAQHLISKCIPEWRMDVEGTLPEDMKRRGVDDPNVLPNYCYRDDGLLLYSAIEKYVTDYVNIYYDDPQDISSDWELQNFGEELTKSRENGGCGIKGVGNNGKFETNHQIAAMCTSIIYTSSVSHAATNFPQYQEYGFPPNFPSMLIGKPPTNKDPLAESDVVAALPAKSIVFEVMVSGKIFEGRGTMDLGYFEVDYIYDPPALPILESFRDDLRKAGETIQERNRQRYYKYNWLNPDNVPNSICN